MFTNGDVLTGHQKLYPSLRRHLLGGMAGDEVEHVRSTVRLFQVRNLERAVLGPELPQVLHPVLIRWVWKDSSAMEHISDPDR